MKEVRRALLEADVSLPVARRFVANVQSKAIGQEVAKGVKPQQQLIKVEGRYATRTTIFARIGMNRAYRLSAQSATFRRALWPAGPAALPWWGHRLSLGSRSFAYCTASVSRFSLEISFVGGKNSNKGPP